VYVKGQPSSYYYGFADKDKKIPVTNKTIFEVGSISKVMTSILLAQEIDFAKMSLSDPVTKYIKNLPGSFNHITLQNLATHTSGLPFNPPLHVSTSSELQAYLENWKPGVASGEEWQYSNLGVGLLSYALENSTKWDFNKLYTRHILSPLKMQSVGVTIPAKLNKYYAQGYDKNNNPTHPTQAKLFPAAYGLKVVAGDMRQFLGAAIGLPGTPSRLLWPMRMTQAAYIKYADTLQGLAWTVHPMNDETVPELLAGANESGLEPGEVDAVYERPSYDGNALIDKTGATEGFRAYIAVIPNKQTGIVLLANKNVSNATLVKTARELLFKLNKWIPA
jgi:beta-lactamase class C